MEEYKKVTISLTQDQLDKLDEIMEREQGYSRSSLVREAVDYYLGYLVQKESVSYLSPLISQNIKLVLGSFSTPSRVPMYFMRSPIFLRSFGSDRRQLF